MLPLYLVTELGFERSWANALVALSRIAGPVAALGAGWTSDKLGPKKALRRHIAGHRHGDRAVGRGRVVVDCTLSVPSANAGCLFFPAAFSALSLVSPPHVRNITISATISVALLVGGGAIPASLGVMGEHGSLALGIMLFGMLLLGNLVLLRHLRFHKHTV